MTSPTGRARDELLSALRRYALREGEFRLASGRLATWYLDARQVTFRGDCADAVGRAVLEALPEGPEAAFDAVGGLTLGADPVALAVARCSGRRAFAVRKEEKGHGGRGRIAGPLERGDRVLVVDDTVTTGGSTLTALEAVLEHGCRVVAVSCLVDRGGELGSRLAEMGVAFHPVLGAPDLGFPFGS